jgi:shikimate kinase
MKKKAEVDENGKSRTYASGTRPAPGAPENVFIAGLPGSGARELAERAAEELGLEYEEISDAKDIDALAGKNGKAAALDARLFADPQTAEKLSGKGLMVYLMADMPLLAGRMEQDPEAFALRGLKDIDALREEFIALEPALLGMAAGILRAEKPLEENVADLLDRWRMLGGTLTYDVHIDGVE